MFSLGGMKGNESPQKREQKGRRRMLGGREEGVYERLFTVKEQDMRLKYSV